MMSLAEWQAVIDVNLTGVFLCGREAARQMIELDSPGLILNISSISKAGNMGQTNYSAAKAGVAAMTVTWARELARYGRSEERRVGKEWGSGWPARREKEHTMRNGVRG